MTEIDRRRSTPTSDPVTRPTPSARRPYQTPVLTEYGRVDDLVDSGVVGSAPSAVPV